MRIDITHNNTDFVYYDDYLEGNINTDKSGRTRVINTETGKIYNSVLKASKDFHSSYSLLFKLLKEGSNKINFKYLEE